MVNVCVTGGLKKDRELIDDIVWYFVAGLFVGPLYKYWKEAKVVNN